MDAEADKKCVVARCACCHRIVYANCGELTSSDRQEIGKMVQDGLSVSHDYLEEIRAADWGCEVRRLRDEARKAAEEAAKPENIDRARYEAAMAEMGAAGLGA